MSQFLASAAFVWLALMVVFLVLEGITVGLASIWFAVGALAAMLVSLFCPAIWAQVLVFAVVSLVTLCLIRPMALHLFRNTGYTPTNADRILSKTGIVTETIDNLAAKGQVKVGGQVWTARSASGDPIGVGVEVTILRMEGVRLYVEPAAIRSSSFVS